MDFEIADMTLDQCVRYKGTIRLFLSGRFENSKSLNLVVKFTGISTIFTYFVPYHYNHRYLYNRGAVADGTEIKWSCNIC